MHNLRVPTDGNIATVQVEPHQVHKSNISITKTQEKYIVISKETNNGKLTKMD